MPAGRTLPCSHRTGGSEEELAWPDLADEDLDEHAYCLIRNHVLAKWRANPLKPLSEEEARAAIIERHRKLALIAHRFLARCERLPFSVPLR